jgi:hypothetical protein
LYAARPVLLFYVSYAASSDVSSVRDLVVSNLVRYVEEGEEQRLVKRCFSSINYHLLPLAPSEDNHVMGARVMMEAMLKHRETKVFNGRGKGNVSSSKDSKDPSYILYMEPDMKPIQSNWLTKTQLACAWPVEPFWVKGSVFRGDYARVAGTDYPPNLYHINGNAIYNLGPPAEEYKNFYFNQLRPYVIKRWGDSRNAYDTDVWEYLYERENYDQARHILGKFVYTDLIHNYWKSEYTISDYVKKHPDTFLVHGEYQNPN